jgi:hypothetical protein
VALSEDFWKADPFQLIGVGLIGVAAPILFPTLRPQFVALLKAGAKLALEAEFDADDALADRLVESAVNALLQVSLQDTEKDLCDRSEATVNRFLAASSDSATRRGWDQQDVAHRYDKHLVKFDHAISRAHPRARAAQRTALAHASKFLRKHHVGSERRVAEAPRGNPVHSGANPDHPSERIRSAWTATRA